MARRKTARPLLWAAAGLFAGTLVAGSALPGGVELTAIPVKGGPPLWVVYLDPGDHFTLRYVHSVDEAPIWEEHSVDRWGRIYVEEERFVMVGAGMGDLPGRGRWTGGGGIQAIQDMHYPVGEFVLRVGSPSVDHTLVWQDTEYHLSQHVPGEAVRVSARPVSRLTRWWRRWFPHPATPASGDRQGS